MYKVVIYCLRSHGTRKETCNIEKMLNFRHNLDRINEDLKFKTKLHKSVKGQL